MSMKKFHHEAHEDREEKQHMALKMTAMGAWNAPLYLQNHYRL